MHLPSSIQKLIEDFSSLPSIGRKSAERLVFYLLTKPQGELDKFADNLKNLKTNVSLCVMCGAISETNPCEICANPNRNKNLICVVCETKNITLIENTKIFNGTYHVLGGLIDMAKNIKPENLNINNLIKRVQQGSATEVILALNPTMEGETTAMYLQNLLKNSNLKISRLARGLPTGADIEYADEKTISEALKHRF